MRRKVQLITYPNRLGGPTLKDLSRTLSGPLSGLFSGVHILPFFSPIDGADAGFDPVDHGKVDPRLGTWEDIRAIGNYLDIVADLIVNHISAESKAFRDYRKKGNASGHADLFIKFDDVFPRGATERDLCAIYRPRPGLPFTKMLIRGEARLLWTTFTSDQIDINLQTKRGWMYIERLMDIFASQGVTTIRLDAVGYAIKKQGTACFMLPETFQLIEKLSHTAKKLGMNILVEIHSHYRKQIEIARQVDWVYDFALPPLVLHALYKGTFRHLKKWLTICPRNAVTVLDTHDGIGVIDVGSAVEHGKIEDGLLSDDEIREVVETIHARSGGGSLQATGNAASNIDLYQVNCTYYDALGKRDKEYLIARAIQLFAPGIPQIYYVGLLAGENDLDLLNRTKNGRDINRHYYSDSEIILAMKKPVVRALFALIDLRNSHPAFEGVMTIPENTSDKILAIRWEKQNEWAQLRVDLERVDFSIAYTSADHLHVIGGTTLLRDEAAGHGERPMNGNRAAE